MDLELRIVEPAIDPSAETVFLEICSVKQQALTPDSPRYHKCTNCSGCGSYVDSKNKIIDCDLFNFLREFEHCPQWTGEKKYESAKLLKVLYS
jgi:hypothetical protein